MSLDNNIIAKHKKLYLITGKANYIHKLEDTDKVAVNSIKRTQNVYYTSFQDGVCSYLLMSKSPSTIFNPILNFSIDKMELNKQIICLKYSVSDNIEIEKIYLICTINEEIEVEIKANQLFIDHDDINRLTGISTFLKLRLIYKYKGINSTFNSNVIIKKNLIVKDFPYPNRVSIRNNIFLSINGDVEVKLKTLSNLIDNNIARFKSEYLGKTTENNGYRYFEYDNKLFGELISNNIKYVIAHPKQEFIEQLTYQRAKEIVDLVSFKNKPNSSLVVKKKVVTKVYKTIGFSNYTYIKSLIKKVKNKNQRNKRYYAKRVDTAKIYSNTVLLEGFNGRRFSGSLVYFAQYLSNSQPQYKLTIACDDYQITKALCKRYNIKATLITTKGKSYYRALLYSEYIFTDTTMRAFYIKTEGQKLIDFWHGTPLKGMGRHVATDPLAHANIQRNFIQSDLLLYNSPYQQKTMLEASDLDKLHLTNELISLPVVQSLKTEKSIEQLKINLGLDPNKKLIVWMPTWRGQGNQANNIEENNLLFARMEKFVSSLSEEYQFYCNIHQLVADKVENFKLNIIPQTVDVYEYLKASEILITDYSSVMFDYAVTNKKIILDIHDYETYSKDRGFLIDLHDFPFHIAKDMKELKRAIVDPTINDYSQFNQTYNPYFNDTSFDLIYQKIFTTHKPIHNNKDNVLIYPGGLLPNGITTSFLNLLSNIDLEEKNYYIFIPRQLIAYKKTKKAIDEIFSYKNLRVIVSPSGMLATERERHNVNKLNHKLDGSDRQNIDALYIREAKRLFGDIKFSDTIHFSGYDLYIFLLFSHINAKGHVFVHSDMKEESKNRNNVNISEMLNFYNYCKTINCVTELGMEKIKIDFGSEIDITKLKLVHNTINSNKVRQLSRIDEAYMTDELKKKLDDPNIKTIINVARYSVEKSLDRLIEAYNIFRTNNPSSKVVLLIAGSMSTEYNRILGLKNASPFSEDIYLFININPFPLLKKSDLFLLSSLYEGLPMVIFEALALDVPVVSTSIPGVNAFLAKGYGEPCENSIEGLTYAITNFIKNGANKPTNDLESFNEQARIEYLQIFNT